MYFIVNFLSDCRTTKKASVCHMFHMFFHLIVFYTCKTFTCIKNTHVRSVLKCLRETCKNILGKGGGGKTLILLIFHKVFHIYVNKKTTTALWPFSSIMTRPCSPRDSGKWGSQTCRHTIDTVKTTTFSSR